MASLASLQALAEREAKKLGIAVPLRVQWAGPSTCKLAPRHSAHAHAHPSDRSYGTICVRRGLLESLRDLMKHEVAHFAARHGHGLDFVKVRAAQGSAQAKDTLRRAGKLRCTKHQWASFQTLTKTQRVTAKGLVTTMLTKAQCGRCGKMIG